jgi:uncharacterized membrane protein YfcA
MTALLGLAVVLIVAHTAETILGFGSTLIALSLGVHLFPLERLLSVLVLMGLVQSVWILSRAHVHIHWRELRTRILPFAALGLVGGILLRDAASESLLKQVLGGFVLVVAVSELVLIARNRPRKLGVTLPVAAPLLTGGGIFHGLFASGGPLIVYYASRAIGRPEVFRATLSALWLVLNIVLTAQFAVAGRLSLDTATLFATALPAGLTGMFIGERIKVKDRAFQALTYGLLVVAAIALLR